MRKMRGAIAIGVVAAALTAWAAVELVGPQAGSARAATQGSEVQRKTHYYGVGPTAHYDFDSGTIGVVRPLRQSFVSGATFDVVITISMNYQTSADDRFVVAPLVRRDGRYGPIVDVRPEARTVVPTTTPTSTTTVFLINDLPGGHTYWFSPTVNVSRRVGDHSSITSRKVVFVVDMTRSP
jgi:hypothetical protein